MARTDYGAILSSVIKDTSDAIREVRGSTNLIAPSQWGTEIRGMEKKLNDVNYFDCFGNIIFDYSASQFAKLTAHPIGSNISKKGVDLTFDSWNYSFSKAQAYVAKYGKLNIGGTYHPADGKTHIFLNIGDSAYSDIDIRFKANSTATIDWGDKSTPQTVSGAFTGKHNYNDSGEFEITIDGNISFLNNILPDTTQAKYLTDVFLNNITTIGFSSFGYCSFLKSVSIPEGITSVGSNTFYYCISLKSISIPKGVTDIGSGIFGYCSFLKSVLISESVTSLGSNAFYYCSSLESLSIPEGVTIIYGYTFQQCSFLKSILIPEGVTKIGNYAFQQCLSLKLVSISEGVTNIGTNAFNYCISLESILIPKSVTTIGVSAFNASHNLVYVDFSEATSIPTLDSSSAFDNLYSLNAIIVPDNLYDNWVVAAGWKAHSNKIVKASEYAKPF